MSKKVNFKRISSLLLCIVAVLFLFNGCSAKTSATGEGSPAATTTATPAVTSSASDSGGQSFTIDELKKFDGQNGNKAYVAIDGVVYDLTNNPKWPNGQHNGLSAGNDLSEAIGASPHGKAILGKLTVVGKLK